MIVEIRGKTGCLIYLLLVADEVSWDDEQLYNTFSYRATIQDLDSGEVTAFEGVQPWEIHIIFAKEDNGVGE